MYTITNFTTNDDIRILGSMGPFTIVQYEQDFSVAPGQAQFAWYCDAMNIRRRQVVCDLTKGAVVVQPGPCSGWPGMSTELRVSKVWEIFSGRHCARR